VKDLFGLYVERPDGLPPEIQKNLPVDGTRRVVCDYIAGMTDRYALDEYKKLFDPYEKV
jgi:dGTPase